MEGVPSTKWIRNWVGLRACPQIWYVVAGWSCAVVNYTGLWNKRGGAEENIWSQTGSSLTICRRLGPLLGTEVQGQGEWMEKWHEGEERRTVKCRGNQRVETESKLDDNIKIDPPPQKNGREVWTGHICFIMAAHSFATHTHTRRVTAQAGRLAGCLRQSSELLQLHFKLRTFLHYHIVSIRTVLCVSCRQFCSGATSAISTAGGRSPRNLFQKFARSITCCQIRTALFWAITQR